MINADNFFALLSLLVLGVFLAGWLLRRAKRRRARTWPSGLGQVRSANVVLESGGGSAAYYANLEYSYTVQGQTYFGRLRRRFILQGRADKWIESFARNGVLTVRYNPEKAEDSVVLESDRPGDASASSILLAALLCFTCTGALAQAASADYTNDLPSVDRVKAEIKGSDSGDTLARQVAVFNYLYQYVNNIKSARTPRGPYTPGEQHAMAAYRGASFQISQDYAKAHTPDEAKAFERLHGQYEMNSDFYADWSKRLIGPQSAAAHNSAVTSLAAGQRAHVAQEQQQYQRDTAAQQAGAGGRSDDPTSVTTRRCLELGGDSTACLGKGIVSGILGLTGLDTKTAFAPNSAGVVLIGSYRSSGNLPTITFGSVNAAVYHCGKLVNDSRGYSIRKSGNSVQIVVDNTPNQILLTMRSDGMLVGPGSINVTGQIVVGYHTVTQQLYVNGQPAYGPNYNCIGACTTTSTVPDYGTATERCTIGSLTPPPPTPAPPASAPDGLLGSLAGMMGTIAPADVDGLRMLGQYTSSSGLLLDFNGAAVILDCGQAHVKAAYTVESTPTQFLVHVQNGGGPFTLAVASDNTLRGSGSTAVNGRLVSGMNGDNVTFTAHRETCNVGTFSPKTAASSSSVAATPTVPAPAPASPVTAAAPSGITLAIHTSFPIAANPLAGRVVQLMSERFDTALRKVGAPIPADTTPGQALQAYSNNCPPPTGCPGPGRLMHPYYVGKAVFDSAGKATLTAPVEPGTYYVFCSANGTKGALVWDLPIILKPGVGNTITLTATNAELVH